MPTYANQNVRYEIQCVANKNLVLTADLTGEVALSDVDAAATAFLDQMHSDEPIDSVTRYVRTDVNDGAFWTP